MALALPVSVIQEARTVVDGNVECDLATTVHNFVRPMAPNNQLTSMAKLDEVQQVGWIVDRLFSRAALQQRANSFSEVTK